MKTTSISNFALTVVVAVFASIQVSAAVAASGNKTEMVKHNNEWMPVYHLPEVAVTATSQKLVEAKEVNGTIMPVVHLQEVMVTASGSFDPADVQPIAVEPTKPEGFRVEAKKVKGVYMPVNEMAAVTITAEAPVDEQVAVNQPVNTQGKDNKVFTISARKSFDVVVNLMVEKAMDLMKKFLNSSR